jgi:hypothetical protein
LKRILVSLVSILSFAALAANQNHSASKKLHLENFSKVSESCDFDITKWKNIVEASNSNDAIFSGDVLFKVEDKQYKTKELYVKNFYIRKNCEIKSSLVVLIK